MRKAMAPGWLLTALAACSLFALDADAAGVLPGKRKLLLKPAGHVAARPPVARPQVIARPRYVPKLAFRAPAPRPLAPRTTASITPLRTVTLAPPATSVIVDGGKPALVALTGDWSVFAASVNGARSCFSATQPKDSAPRLPDRSPAYVYLASLPGGKQKRELTIKLGFNATPASAVTANVDGHDYPLQAAGDVAYPPNDSSQRDLLQAMRHGHTLLVRSTLASQAAAAVTDSISLLGMNDSMRLLDKACADPAALN